MQYYLFINGEEGICGAVRLVARRAKDKKKPIVGDGQRLHTAIRCFTQGISMLINQCVDLKPWANSRHTDFLRRSDSSQ